MTKKLYRMPANENELSENGQLEIMVSANRFDMEITWECKNPVTAYKRFRKAYLQAVEDGAIPATLAAGVAKNFGLPEKVKAVKDEFGATVAFVDASENVGDMVTVNWDRNHFFVEDNEESFYICMLIDGEEIENYADIEKTYTEDAVVETEQEEETTMAIETKTSANGSKIYYVNGKRVSRDKAIEAAADQREDNLFTVTVERIFELTGGETKIEVKVAECKKLETRIGRYGYERDIEVNGEFALKLYSDDDARAIVDRITEAYLAGYAGCKITAEGRFEVIEATLTEKDPLVEVNPDEYASTPEALDAAVEAEIGRAIAATIKTGTDTLNFELNFYNEKSAKYADELNKLVEERDARNVAIVAESFAFCKGKIAEIKAALANIAPAQFTLPNAEINLVPQDGRKGHSVTLNVLRRVRIINDGEFKFQYFYRRACAYRTIAKYGTADEVNLVIDMLNAAANHGDKSFKFPTFTDDNGLNQADIAEIQKDLTAPIAEPTDKPTPTIREKMLAVKDKIRCVYGRYLDDGRYAKQWEKKTNGHWEKISKKTAAAFLEIHGLTLNEFYVEKEQWIAEEIARSAAQMAAEDRARDQHIKDKITRDSKPLDTDNAFGLLPTPDELNDFTEADVDDDTEYTERDARFNHGERHAAKLQKELRKIDPTVEVTYGIDDEDGHDFFHMRFDGIFGSYCPTIADTREMFYRLKADIAEAKTELTEANATPKTHAAAVTADRPATKLEVLKAKRDAAWAKVIETQAALLKAHDAHIAAENDFDAADIAYCYAAADMACDLNAKLDLPIDTLDVTTQGGLNWIIALDKIEVTFDDDAFKFHCELSDGTDFTLGTYDTPERAEKVINLLKTAVTRGDIEFTFQTVDELNQPDAANLRDSLKRAMNIALANYRDFCRLNNLTAAEHELKLYNICRKALKEVA